MNNLWRTFFENIKLINLQVKNRRLDPKKVSLSQEKNLKKHKQFFMFWFKELIPQMGPETDLENVKKFLQKSFQNIYGEGPVFWLLKLSRKNRNKNIENRKKRTLSESTNLRSVNLEKLKVQNSYELSEKIIEKRRISLRKDSGSNINNLKEKDDKNKIDYSMIVSDSFLNDFNTPVKENLKMVKEEPIMTTDSEMEEYDKSVKKFKNKKPQIIKKTRFGEALDYNKNETFDTHSKYNYYLKI